MKRLASALTLVLLFMASLAAGPVPAWAAPGVAMTVRPAGEGRVKPNTWTTIAVDLTNQGSELTGELVVDQDGPPGADFKPRRPQYVVPVSLPSGGKKHVTVSVPVTDFGQQVVRLVSGGRTVAEQTYSLTMLPMDVNLVGVLSGDELGVPGLTSGSRGTTQVVRLDADSFPQRAAQLEPYNVIALSRFDTSTLSREQVRALESWVGQGGTLLLAGGPEWKRTFAGLPQSLVPVAVGEVRDADLSALGSLVGKPLTGRGPISAGQAARGQVIAADAGVPLLVNDRVGAGQVVYLAADPGLRPLADWAGQPDLMDRYAVSNKGVPFNWGGPSVEQMMMGALQQIPGLGLPSVGLVALLLLGYLLLVGPVNYWILKRMDRREWGWGTVPLISLLFVGAVYGLSVGRRVPLVSHLVTVTELSPGTTAARFRSFLGIYAPSRSKLELAVESGRLVRPIDFGGQMDEVTARIITGEKTTVEIPGLNNYSMKGLSVEADVAVTGGLELVGARYDGGVLRTRVKNGLAVPVRDALVETGIGEARVGNLEPGATSDEVTLNIGQMQNPKQMRPFSWNGAPGQRPDPEWNRRAQVWNAVFEMGGQRATSGTILVAGWTDQPLSGTGLPELGRVYQGANLVYAEVPIPSDPASGNIPPGVIIATPLEAKGISPTPMGVMLPPGSYTFALQFPPMQPDRVAEVHVIMPNPNWNMVIPSVRNRKTGEWVALQKLNDQALADWQSFVGPDGRLELKLDVSAHTEMSLPTVSAKGVSR